MPLQEEDIYHVAPPPVKITTPPPPPPPTPSPYATPTFAPPPAPYTEQSHPSQPIREHEQAYDIQFAEGHAPSLTVVPYRDENKVPDVQTIFRDKKPEIILKDKPVKFEEAKSEPQFYYKPIPTVPPVKIQATPPPPRPFQPLFGTYNENLPAPPPPSPPKPDVRIKPVSSPQNPVTVPLNNVGGVPQPQNSQVGATTPHPLVFGFKPVGHVANLVSSTLEGVFQNIGGGSRPGPSQNGGGSFFRRPPPPGPHGPHGAPPPHKHPRRPPPPPPPPPNFRQPKFFYRQTYQQKSRPVRFPSLGFFY